MQKLLAIVVPCYNEEASIDAFLSAVSPVLASLVDSRCYSSTEIVFIDDGSTDSTLEILRSVSSQAGISYISFSRNFGKEAALLAGLEKALQLNATDIVVMDVDLQDPPELLPEMVRVQNEKHCDIVATRRSTRKGEPVLRSWFADRFYDLMNSISDVKMLNGARDYRLMTRRVVEAIVQMPENQRFSKGLFAWVGFHVEWIEYENVERFAGDTHWSFFALFNYALDSIVAFSTAPLVAISVMGVIVSLLALLMLIIIIARTLAFGDPVAGWPSLVCIILFVSGIQILSMGVLGMYLSKTYSEVKRRPVYLVAEDSDSHVRKNADHE